MSAIRPFCLIRIGYLYTSRIGHFAGNTELYCCELDAGINIPETRFMDLFFVKEKVSNKQLLKMWRRELNFLPAVLLYPIHFLTYFYPNGSAHRVRATTQHDRDIFNLFDRFPAHLRFTDEEETLGKSRLADMGINEGDKFICLNVRDSAFFPGAAYNYHSYRDCSIDNYVYTAEQLAGLGFTVIRMGVKVNKKLESQSPRIIDYASNGMRSDFMDIYLGAKCYFTISTSSGWDGIPYIFRRPIAFAPFTPIGYLFTFSFKYVGIFKHHILAKEYREMTFEEIFRSGLAYALTANEFENRGVHLREPTPEEIWDLVNEMVQMAESNFEYRNDTNSMQQKLKNCFLEFKKDGPNGRPLHGEIKSLAGNKFLETNINLISESYYNA
ncbi:MAG TPA: TIGR04372 family glycosyltransferase [Emticicia sp.]